MPTHEHKETRMSLAGNLISMVDQDIDFLNIIVTVNETCCFLYMTHSININHVSGNPNYLTETKNPHGQEQRYVGSFL
jgi:hypothetical protein